MGSGHSPYIRGLLSNGGVRQALDRLAVRYPLSAEAKGRLVPFVLVWAAFAVQKTQRSAYWQKLFASDTQKSWRQLKNFPKRLRAMAADLDTLRRSGRFGQETGRRLWSIPEDLNDRANGIELQINELEGVWNRRRRSDVIAGVSDSVKYLTGHFCHPEVARLLNALDLAQNGKQQAKMSFDAQTVARIRSQVKRGDVKPKTTKT